jgi:hypothetical protein
MDLFQALKKPLPVKKNSPRSIDNSPISFSPSLPTALLIESFNLEFPIVEIGLLL